MQTLIVVTRLRLSSAAHRVDFMDKAFAVGAQAHQAAGIMGTDVFPDANDAFWTATCWRDDSSMRSFMLAEPHRSTMTRISEWCDEATYVEWTQEGATLPDWADAHARLVADGIVTPLANPSPAHASRSFPAPAAS